MPRKEHMDQRPPDDEEARDFSHFFNSLDEGNAAAEASVALQELVKETSAKAAHRMKALVGTLNIALAVAIDETGVSRVTYEIKAKPPKHKTQPSTFWVSKGGNLTPNNPRQIELGIRDVSRGQAPARDVAPVAAAPREA